ASYGSPKRAGFCYTWCPHVRSNFMSNFATILQLSDFHFGRQLTHERRDLYKTPFLFAKAKSHNWTRLASLSREIEKIERKGSRIDVLLVTGDLATDGSPLSHELCLRYINNDWIEGGPASRAAWRALRVDAKRRILLPGNHDRFNRSWVGFQKPGTD